MLYGFKVAPSLAPVEAPGRAYFDSLMARAVRALAVETVEYEQAWAYCEYLDAVDSRAMASVPAVYQRCLTGLLRFLETGGRDDIEALVAKSWAAKTCDELSQQTSGVVLRFG